MITHREAERLRERLLTVLAEDAHNTQRLLGRIESITEESGIDAHAALLLILTRLPFEEDQARRHWEAILAHREGMSEALGRDTGVRTAMLDYFVNVNRRLVEPTLIELTLSEPEGADPVIDPLTGLASDRRFRTTLQNEIRRARRYGLRVAVVAADIDAFAELNATFGPLVGDRILRELAMVLNNNIRDIDLAARPGGDEIVLLLPETDRNGALLVAERFRREVESFFARRECLSRAVGLTISAGVSCYPDDATTPETLLERAAQALYHAKAAGRNTVHLYHPDRRRYLRFELEPGRFEIEVFAPADPTRLRGKNLSRNGILFASPERIEVGEHLEIRVQEPGAENPGRPLRLGGRVVRLEELPESGEAPESADPGRHPDDRFEVGVALDLDWAEGTDDLIVFLERAQDMKPDRRS